VSSVVPPEPPPVVPPVVPFDPPRFRLFDGPSPLHRLPRFSAALGGRVDVWIKREDLLPLAFGGNKLRNLEFLVGAALAEGADTLVTSGRRWSNHCRLTAAAGAVAGLAVELVVSGPPTEPPGPGVQLMHAFGATVHQLATADRSEREARVAAVMDGLREGGRRPYLIEVGGSGLPGLLGQVAAADEVARQLAAPGQPRPASAFSALYLPSATGGTQAGLIARDWLAFDVVDGPIMGIVVGRPAAELRSAIIRSLDALEPFFDRAGAPDEQRVPASQVHLDQSWLGAGYGRPTTAAAEAADLLARSEGILVDPIYTAKALAGLIGAVRSGQHDGASILFWHAGGTPGVFEPLD
jgi:1-aminocyclopropane-1-carboxylate deaminase/D-cysteine desulfhydrase-like pyridoxal-dependent ACC family enzyme